VKCAQQEKPYYSEHVGNSMSPVLGTSQLGGVKNYSPGGRLGGDIFGGVDSSIAERKSPLWVTNSIVGGVLLENLDCKLLADMLRIANNKAGRLQVALRLSRCRRSLPNRIKAFFHVAQFVT